MRTTLSKLTRVMALGCWCFAAVGCADGKGDGVDGGGGTGGSATDKDAAGLDAGTVGCLTEAPTACPTPAVRYGDVQPIFQQRCVAACHNDHTIDPVADASIWGLGDYNHVSSWKDTIRPAIFECSMPPVDSGIAITVEERRAILEWLRCGAPE